MKHLGDITKLRGNNVPPVEIITGGSPCQDLSTAGKRAGLQGERSGLFIEQIRLIKEMRDNDKACGRTDKHIRPRFMVWENVPGAFSSNQGEDFRIVLEETARVADPDAVILEPPKGKWQPSGCILGDGWSIAWRVHDAQFWGVPQRRKRISLVADFAGVGAPEILFEREGVPGDTEPGEQTREAIARDTSESTGIPSAYTLKIRGGVERDSVGRQAGKEPLIQTDLSATFGAVQGQTLFCCDQAAGKSSVSVSENISPTLATTHDGAPVVTVPNQGGMAVCEPINGELVISIEGTGSRPSHNGDGYSESGKMYTLNTIERHCVAYRKTAHPQNAEQGQGWEETDVHDTMNSFDSSEARTPTVVVDRSGEKIQGFDAYNQAMTGDVSKPPTNKATDSDHIPIILDNHPNDSRVKISDDGKVQTLSSRMGTGGGNVPMVMEGPICTTTEMTPKVDSKGVAFSLRGKDYKDPQCVSYANDAYDKWSESEKSASLRASGGVYGGGSESLLAGHVVRRLTPLECERLQGFPDHWTDIGEWTDSKGKKHKDADSPRYKALGNSIALPFWEWMAKRMVAVLRADGVDEPTMASLFDGIGGFPLVYQRTGCKPVWASEIEEFPIAVTKIRFPEV